MALDNRESPKYLQTHGKSSTSLCSHITLFDLANELC